MFRVCLVFFSPPNHAGCCADRAGHGGSGFGAFEVMSAACHGMGKYQTECTVVECDTAANANADSDPRRKIHSRILATKSQTKKLQIMRCEEIR